MTLLEPLDFDVCRGLTNDIIHCTAPASTVSWQHWCCQAAEFCVESSCCEPSPSLACPALQPAVVLFVCAADEVCEMAVAEAVRLTLGGPDCILILEGASLSDSQEMLVRWAFVVRLESGADGCQHGHEACSCSCAPDTWSRPSCLSPQVLEPLPDPLFINTSRCVLLFSVCLCRPRCRLSSRGPPPALCSSIASLRCVRVCVCVSVALLRISSC
jgi:hypothetical protein